MCDATNGARADCIYTVRLLNTSNKHGNHADGRVRATPRSGDVNGQEVVARAAGEEWNDSHEGLWQVIAEGRLLLCLSGRLAELAAQQATRVAARRAARANARGAAGLPADAKAARQQHLQMAVLP